MIEMNKDAETLVRIAKLYKEIMNELGIGETDDNKETPLRVAKSLFEMTDSVRDISWGKDLEAKCTTFVNRAPLVLLEQDDIEFSSMCSHHHLPFFGKVKITYIAGKRIIGLSKFNRVVEYYSKFPQVQEDMTVQIAEYLFNLLLPKYLRVEIYDCQHTCMCSRGVKSRAKTSTVIEFGER